MNCVFTTTLLLIEGIRMILLNNFFYPNNICLVGASSKEKSIGYEILKTIVSYGFTGNVFPVNPKAENILGYPCYKSIEEIKEKIDLAIIVVPKQFVEDAIDSLLAKKVDSIILITAGFKETGSDGEALEKRILEKIKLAKARLVGPNCMGIINSSAGVKLNATFVAEKPEFGSTGFLSQSGALGAAVLNSLRETNIKFAHFISVGNKADVCENDVLKFWQNDSNIKTLTFYLESFVDGKNFILPFINGIVTKPTIILKAGKTAGGMKAASSHTGALSSKDKIVDAVLNQFGIIRADNLNELFNTAKGFEYFNIPHGNRIAVVTNAGGPAILCVDALEKENLSLANFSDETKAKLREIVHSEGSVENPVDLLPGGNAETYKQVLEIISSDKNVDALISIFVEPVMVEPFSVVESVNSIESEKPIAQVIMPLPEFWNKYTFESHKKLPLFRNPEDPAEIFSNLLFYKNKQTLLNKNFEEYRSIANTKSSAIEIEPGFIPQDQIEKIANKYNVPLPRSMFLSPNKLLLKEINFYPVVLKGINANVVHKSELNAVRLNIKNKNELIAAADEIQKSFSLAGFEVENYLVQEFVKTKHELLVGGFRDPSFGPVIMFGSGGKYVEIYNDTSIKSCFLSGDDIDEMISSTNIGKILLGVRGESEINITHLKQIIKNCSLMMIENENILEFDINPLSVSADNKFVAVDLRIKLA